MALTDVTYCEVQVPIQQVTPPPPEGPESIDSYTGSMTLDCGVVCVTNITGADPTTGDTNKNSQSECSFVVLPDGSNIVTAYFDTHLRGSVPKHECDVR